MKKIYTITIIIILCSTIIISKSINYNSSKVLAKINNYKNTNKHIYNLNIPPKIVIPHQSRIADAIRVKTIQFAGQFNLQDYKTGLYEQLNIITTLNPYWEQAYILGQLLLPAHNNPIANQNFIKLGQKGIKNLCNKQKIYKISKTNIKEYEKILQNKKINNICKSYELPKNLAFNYFYYKKDLENSILFYKIASLSPGANKITSQMPAIISGRLGENQKSANIWYEKFLNEKEKKGKQTEYYLKKALTEQILQIIKNSKKKDINNKCKNNLQCLKGFIKKEIENLTKKCKDKQNNFSNITKCNLLFYGINNNFIKTNGELIYPLDPNNFEFARRTDIQNRRIKPLNQSSSSHIF